MDWADEAECRGYPSDVFFPERGGSDALAKLICEMCPVIEECGEYAIVNVVDFGVWGGMSARQRIAIRRSKNYVPTSSISPDSDNED